MARDIFEQETLGVVALLQKGKPAGATVEFNFTMDGKEIPEGKGKIAGQISADPAARTGKAATCKFTPPAVPEDKPSYLLDYSIKVDGQLISDRTQFKVWPKKLKVTTIHEADSKAFPKFKFKVKQGGKTHGNPYTTEGDPAVKELTLEKGKGFVVEGFAPFEVKSVENNGKALRDLKVKGVLKPVAEFVSPTIPKNKQLKQYVNLAATAKKGRDGLGNKIVFQIGVKGDRDEAGKTIPDPFGKAGVKLFVKVKFGPDPGKSKRNSPKTALLAGLNASEVAAVTDGVEYKGKVEMAAAGGIGEFEIELGYAGGDTCEVSIGGTEAATDAKVTITNWRKLLYEMKYPAMLEAKLGDTKVGEDTLKDYPTALRDKVKSKLAAVFLEFTIHKSHKFADAKATPADKGGMIVTAAYLNDNSGGNRYVCTSGIVDGAVGFSDEAATKNRSVYVTVCDRAFSNGATRNNYAPEATAADHDWNFGSNYLFEPSPKNGAQNLKVDGKEWTAVIANPETHKKRPTVEYEADESRDDAGKNRTITVTETLQGKSVNIEYKNPAIGHTPQDMDGTRKGAIDTFLTSLYGVPALRSKGNKLKFKLTGMKGDDRRNTRFQNLKDYISNKVSTAAPKIPVHPALADDGTVRKGPVTLAWLSMKTYTKLNCKLPTSPGGTAEHLKILPGDFVGPSETDTKCKVTVGFSVETTYEINGNAGDGKQLMVLRTAGPASETVCHELGHSMGMCIIPGTTNEPGPPNVEIKHVDNGGTYYFDSKTGPWTNGLRNLHRGGHCSHGIPNGKKSDSKFDGWNPTANGCIMWGSGGDTETRPSYCPKCTEIIKARRLEDIRTDSASRPA